MALTFQQLFEPSPLAAAPTVALYTAQATTRIDAMTVTNSTGTAATFNLFFVPGGKMANAANQIVSSRSVQPGESWIVGPAIGHMLQAGDQMYAYSSTANALILFASGVISS